MPIRRTIRLSRLRELSLRQQRLTAKAIKPLAESILHQLSALDLSGNHLGDSGADRLTAIGPWPALSYLDVRDNGISRPAKMRMKDVFGELVQF